MTGNSTGPHQDQPILTAGEPLDRAQAAVVMMHGRGATAENILTLAPELDTSGLAYVAPQAAENSWYPYSFMAPLHSNEPGISSGLAAIEGVLAKLAEANIPPERTVLLGFSQGACLSVEFAARNARRYGGVVGLSGGLIGPDGLARDYSGSLKETPVFLGCSDEDPHIPKMRVQHTADVLTGLSGDVTTQLYPKMGHLVNQDEIAFVQGMLAALIK
jgi:predicted esterase